MGDSTIAIASAISLFLVPSICSKYVNSKGFIEDDNNNTKNLIKYNNNNNNNDIKNDDSITETSKSRSSSKLLDWNTAIQIPWGVLILMGGGLALAHALHLQV
jgi:sodium-dependent dicarboxylate transporter 2/3/5